MMPPKNLSVTIIDLPAAVSDLESELEKDIHAQPLYKTMGMQIMLIGLKTQSELKKHSAPGPISVQVIKGAISFRTDETEHDLKSGQILALSANVPHSVYAKESSIFLVTKSIAE